MVEQPAVNRRVAGSSPASGANFPQEAGEIIDSRTDSAQNTAKSEYETKVRFPKKIRRRGHVLATIYAKRKNYPFYRLAYRINGKRLMKHFRTYSEANREGKKLVKDLAKGAQVAALTAAQARDALAAFERLLAFYQSTGRRVSLLGGISEYCEAASKLHGRTVGEAVDGYLGTVASVKRKDVAEAVEEFIRAEEPRTKASDNQRAQLSAKYAYNRAIMLRRFASMCSKTPVCDLAKEHLDVFIGVLAQIKSKSNRKPITSAKARNHYRAALWQFCRGARLVTEKRGRDHLLEDREVQRFKLHGRRSGPKGGRPRNGT